MKKISIFILCLVILYLCFSIKIREYGAFSEYPNVFGTQIELKGVGYYSNMSTVDKHEALFFCTNKKLVGIYMFNLNKQIILQEKITSDFETERDCLSHLK